MHCLFRSGCLGGKGDLYTPGSRPAFTGDALDRLTNSSLQAQADPACRIATETRPVRNRLANLACFEYQSACNLRAFPFCLNITRLPVAY